jgi:hypothetical protein
MISVKISYYNYYGLFICEGEYVSQETDFRDICYEIEYVHPKSKFPCFPSTETDKPKFALIESTGRKRLVFFGES